MNPTTAKGLLDGIKNKVRREHATKADQLEWARKEAARREAERLAFCAAHGDLVWRAMPWFGQHRFVTDLLRDVQTAGYLTSAQVDGLRNTINYLERKRGTE